MQLTYSQTPDAYAEGDLADSGPHDIVSTIAETDTTIEPGLVVVRGTDPDRQAQLPESTGADADAIHDGTATVALGQTITSFNGTIGNDLLAVPLLPVLTIASHADIAAGNWVLTYEDPDGVLRTLTVATTTDTGATGTGTYAMRRAISLVQPATDGTGGTFTVGTAAGGALGGETIGVAVRTHKARRDGASANCEDYEDESRMPVCRAGRIAVKPENAYRAGDRVFVRVTAGASERLGAIRVGDSDSGDCLEWAGARMVSSGAGGTIGVMQVLGR